MALPKPDLKYNAVGRSVNCYFCNEFFDEKSLQGHLMQCGAVLDPCPKKCGVYVQRQNKNKHLTQCTAKPIRPRSTVIGTHDSLQRELSLNDLSVPRKYTENDIESLKFAFQMEKQARAEIEKQLQSLQNMHIQYLQHNKQLNKSLENLKKNWYEEIDKRKSLIQKTKLELENIYSLYKNIEEWKKGVDCDMQQIKYQLQANNNKIVDVEYELKDQENRLISFDQVKVNNLMLNKKFEDEQIKWQLEFTTLTEKYEKFQDFFQEENAMIGALWSDQTNEIKSLKETLETQLSELNDVKAKFHVLKFETKNVEQIGSSTIDKVGYQQKEINEIRHSIAQLEQDLELTSNMIADNASSNVVYNGHLLWRINNYKERLDKAKENNTILKSPIFYSKQHGYKLRIQVYLNGIGKWKGRHIIISLQVLKGDWDPLLLWPCNIEAKISLKDQTTLQGKDYIKTISAKRQTPDEENEDPQESSPQYIFIPHATLEKQNYIQNNIIFFEIKVINDNLT